MSKFIRERKQFRKISRYPVSDFAIIVMLTVSFFCLFLGGKAQQAKTMEEQDERRFSYHSEYYADFITGDMDMDIREVFASDIGNISITNVDVFSDYEILFGRHQLHETYAYVYYTWFVFTCLSLLYFLFLYIISHIKKTESDRIDKGVAIVIKLYVATNGWNRGYKRNRYQQI